MATFVYEYINELENNWQEVDILLDYAEDLKNNEENEKLYNALCRSISVLLVAHLEGFLKNLIKNLINDLNYNLSFVNMPEDIKTKYCEKYLGDEKVNLAKLKDKFEFYNIKITEDIFSVNGNKNPKASIIDSIFKNFGLQNIFFHVKELHNDQIFDDMPLSNSITLLTSIKNDLLEGTKFFVYNFNSDTKYNKKMNTPPKTMWEEFLEQINKSRHDVAHGNNFDNISEIQILKKNKIKVCVLQYLLTYILCDYMAKEIK